MRIPGNDSSPRHNSATFAILLTIVLVASSLFALRSRPVAAHGSNIATVISSPETLPAGILSDVPLTISNNQTVSTPVPYQQMLTVDSSLYSSQEASNMQNVEFFRHDGTLISSWLESGNSNNATATVYWLRLTQSIPAGGSTVVYMGFAGLSVNLFDGSVVGEAPRLSPLYGQYDNGGNVFSFYDNFAGTTLKSQWNSFGSGGASGDLSQVLVNNNLTLVPTLGALFYQGTWIGSTQTPSAQLLGPIAADADIAASQPVTNFARFDCQIGCFETRFGFEDTLPNNLDEGNGLGFDIAQPSVLTVSNNQFNEVFVPMPTTTLNQFNVYTVSYSLTSANFQLNYASLSTALTSNVPAPSQQTSLFFETNFQQISPNIDWVRTRNITPQSSMSLSLNNYFTDSSLAPLPHDQNGNPKVDVIISRGIVKSTNPGQIVAWTNATNTGSVSLDSFSLTETLPVDWDAHPSWLPAKGAIHVYFAYSNGTRVEITDPGTITMSNGDPETMSVAISDLSGRLAGTVLHSGDSLLISVKMSYMLIGTMVTGSGYPRTYSTMSNATAWAQPSYSVTSVSAGGSATFTAYAKLLGDLTGDGKVDIIDCGMVAHSYAAHTGDKDYLLVADLNGDGYVGITDVSIVFRAFGDHL